MPASTPWWSTPSIAAPRPGRRPTLGLAAAIVALIPLTARATMVDPPSPPPSASYPPQILHAVADSYAVYPATYGIAHGICERSAMHDVPASAALPAGSPINRSMDQVDRYCVGRVLEYAPDLRSVRWYGGTGGYAYAVTPLTTYQRDGRYCRDFRVSARFGGQSVQQLAAACRGADGVWHSASQRTGS